MFNAKIVADSINSAGERITSLEITFPRIVLAEFNTHRRFSRNSASSRAIPYRKMVKEAIERPFIPMAFQKEHSGMQGTEYFEEDELISLKDYAASVQKMFGSKGYEQLIPYFEKILHKYRNVQMTPTAWWLAARDKAVETSMLLAISGVSKQLCNRILEPFMWHKVLVTSTEWKNFFHLRCPQYFYEPEEITFTSRITFEKYFFENFGEVPDVRSDLEWLRINKSGAEIHISRIAELIHDAIEKSEPVYLSEGEWHMPYADIMDEDKLDSMLGEIQPASLGWYNEAITNLMLKVSTARSARLSYQTLGDNPVIDYNKDVELHDDLLKKEHMSPMEHCGQCSPGTKSRNFTGFLQYRQIVENKTLQV